jgi:hypothetical protein
VKQGANERWVNFNYYDDAALYEAVRPFILDTLRQQIALGVDTGICFALGKKNARYLEELNREGGFFGQVVALDHPRYIVQYKSREMDAFVGRYLETLK